MTIFDYKDVRMHDIPNFGSVIDMDFIQMSNICDNIVNLFNKKCP